MDILTREEMLEQYNTLELKLVEFINESNAQFQETEEMKVLQAYADTSRVLIQSLNNEVSNPFRADIRSLNSKDVVTHHSCPEALLESMRYSLNIKYGVSREDALKGLIKNLE